jgi:hypothetical protein
MRALWTRIGLGALAIFALGMMFLTLLHSARDSAVETLAAFLTPPSAGAEAAPAAPLPPEPPAPPAAPVHQFAAAVRHQVTAAAPDLAFRLDGDRLGGISRLSIRREKAGDLPEVNLTIALDGRVDASRLRQCDLLPVDGQDVAGDEGFECSQGGDDRLVTIGAARFEPLGITRPIRVRESNAADLRDGDPFEATADLGGPIRVTARGAHGEGVNLQAGPGAANLHIRDALGRALVRLLADSTGASLRVRGKDGREIVSLQAGKGGFALLVDTTAVP